MKTLNLETLRAELKEKRNEIEFFLVKRDGFEDAGNIDRGREYRSKANIAQDEAWEISKLIKHIKGE